MNWPACIANPRGKCWQSFPSSSASHLCRFNMALHPFWQCVFVLCPDTCWSLSLYIYICSHRAWCMSLKYLKAWALWSLNSYSCSKGEHLTVELRDEGRWSLISQGSTIISCCCCIEFSWALRTHTSGMYKCGTNVQVLILHFSAFLCSIIFACCREVVCILRALASSLSWALRQTKNWIEWDEQMAYCWASYSKGVVIRAKGEIFVETEYREMLFRLETERSA